MKKSALGFAILLISLVTAVQAWAVRSGGTFVFCAPYGGDVFSLDMHKTANTQDYIVGLNIFRSLYKWDSRQNKPVLSLARDVNISDDGMVYTFTIRDDVKFHNGRTMTVDDIIYSYNRIMKLDASPSTFFIKCIKGALDVQNGTSASIAGLEKINAHTLKITLNTPVDLGYQLYKIETSIVPIEEVKARGNSFGSAPVGCGPFRFVKWVKGSEIVLEKFQDYYEPGKPYLDKVVYRIMSQGAARDMAFRAGELDANLVGGSQYAVYKKDPDISGRMVEVAEMYTRLMGFNRAYKPLSDKRVRQAICHAIDGKLIIEKLLKGKAYQASSFLPATSPAFDSSLLPYSYDVKKAKALMAAAGYEKGFDLEVIATDSQEYGVRVLEAMIPFLKKIHIHLIPRQLEGGMLSQRLNKSDFQAFMWSLESGPDPLESMMRYHSKTKGPSGNYIMYSNPRLDALLDKARNTKDEKLRTQYLKQANKVLYEDIPEWFFNYNKAVIAYQPWVHGIEPVAVEMMLQDFTNLWVDETSPRANEK